MTLKVYAVILETIRGMRPVIEQIGRRDADLGRQLRRAVSSVALNTAEGAGNEAGHRRERFRSALGSAKETRACLEVADALGYAELDVAMVGRLDAIAAQLYRLSH